MPTHNLSPRSAAERAAKVVALKPTAQKLQPSGLKLTQTELLGMDVDLSTLNIALKGSASIHVIEAVTDIPINRTIEGASSVTVNLIDQDRSVWNSGRLAKGNDIEIDGLWFRLAGVTKQGDSLQLVFEDREVNVLREYQTPMHVAWGSMSRQQFVKRILEEPKEMKIKYVIEGINDSPVKGKLVSKKSLPKPADKLAARSPGFSPGSNITVKNQPANSAQKALIEQVLDVGVHMIVKRKLLVAAVMCITQESSATNLPPPLPGAFNYLSSNPADNPTGAFQQRKTMGWPASRDIVQDATAFYNAAIKVDAANPGMDYAALVEAVQNSGNSSGYALWRIEAERTVTAYGLAGGDTATSESLAAGNAQQTGYATAGGGAQNYEFTRGYPTTENGVTKWVPEDSWTCLQRLANEINWRCYVVSGTVYFVSEEKLFQSKPMMTIEEHKDGVDDIDGNYDVGKHDAVVNVGCRTARWAAPPGSVAEIVNCGPFDGRWLVRSIQRSIFGDAATVALSKPRPVLPEPKQTATTGAGSAPTPVAGLGKGAKSDAAQLPVGSGRRAVVEVALKAAADEKTHHYHYLQLVGAARLNCLDLSGKAHDGIDCSSFFEACYKAAGLPDPSGLNYNPVGNTQTLASNGTWTTDPMPGDAVMYGTNKSYPDHVGVYVGDGEVVEIGSDLGVRHTTVPDGSTHPLLGYVQFNLA